jgi:hypothetical protein
MKRPVKSGAASLKALGIVVVLGAAAHAGMPYLPLIGPPPLRMLATKNPHTAVIIKLEAIPTATSTNTLADVEAKVLAGMTNAATTFYAASDPSAGAPANPSLEQTYGTSVFALPTPDLLSITPQMLATYFRPVQFGTNAAVVGPFHVGFMPPLPPVKPSHAEYIVK